ncbi:MULTISPECIES: cardiolipin synthase [Cryobacterium]|uniref:Cardiolipin synthase n=1 Tax=Cryobacterium breve TaxID=1259258 RepID=A0ABY2J019_9MICO|nr:MULTISPECIES: cardiolipin synthase [Cryobacterium]TFC91718.1 cardiolipin synthase [Cryobacterium sp. TmT3-12]TFC98267.1 cardiolipin synthase [Cryobacterium breve]
MFGIDISTVILVIALVVDFTIRVVAIIVVPRNRRPTSGMAWLLAIFFLPYIGALLFLLIGYRTLPKKRLEMQEEINQFILDSTEGIEQVRRDHPWPQWLDSVVELNRNLGSMPLVGGNQARLLGDYESTFAEMVTDIDRARNFVHVEFYILSLDPTTAPFFDALENAVKRGVTVRVLMDHIQSMRKPGYRKTLRRLTDSGVKWELLLPLQPLKGKWQRPDLRNHRKVLVIDGIVGYMGSQNVIDRTYNMSKNIRRGLKWKDLMTRVEGPIVSGLNAIFITDWYSETDDLLTRDIQPVPTDIVPHSLDCQVVPSGPGFEGENNLRLFLALLYYAQERIIITSPYFVPDESIMYAITTATQRGLHVELFVSEVGDQALVHHAQRSYYEELLRAGVKIYLYKAPYVLHAKHFTIDDEVAVIGSSNMDMRSFSLNFEVSMMVRGRSFVKQLREVEDGYRADSRELTLEEWMKQPLRSTVLDNLARLTSAVQ